MYLMIGLDPVPERMAECLRRQERPLWALSKAVVEATFDLPIVGYKANTAFFEAEGARGVEDLREVIRFIKENSVQTGKKRVVIVDGKRGDIGSTNRGYWRYVFEYLGGDGLTVHPYLGEESLEEMLVWSRQRNKILLVLCKTSNPGGREFQDLELASGEKVYERVARQVKEVWSKRGECGVVVGATYPEDLRRVRELVGKEMVILAPGVGAQGGKLAEVLEAAGYWQGGKLWVPLSRRIIYPPGEIRNLSEYKEKVRAQAQAMVKE